MSVSNFDSVRRSLEPDERPDLGPQMNELEPSPEEIDVGKSKDGSGVEIPVPEDVEGVYSEELEESRRRIEEMSLETAEDLHDLHSELKDSLVDRVAYHEIIRPQLGEDFFEEFADKYGLEDDEEIFKAFKGAEDYSVTIDNQDDGSREVSLLFAELDEYRENPDNSVLKDENEAADAIISDYYFRGGKGLRSTLSLITEWALKGDISFESAYVGSLIENLHTSTLIQDDDFDQDDVRRGRESAPVLNRDFYGRYGEMLSILDGNEHEAWSNKSSVISSLKRGIPVDAQFAFTAAQEKVNEGQRTDELMEGDRIEDTSVSDYEEMTVGKTGFLFATAVKMVLDKVHKREESKPGTVYSAFNDYIENFNYAFQGMDDFLEAFREINKSDTDIANRKNTFPAINTYKRLEEEEDRIDDPEKRPAEFFRYFFDKEWEELGEYEEWHYSTAEQLGVDLPQVDEGTDKLIREVMREYGQDVTERQLIDYAERGFNSISSIEDNLDGRGVELLERFIRYMPERAI